MAATAIGALADFSGGAAAGFARAYIAVAVLMLLMLGLSFLLRPGPLASRPVQTG